jgi:hypothetical protein
MLWFLTNGLPHRYLLTLSTTHRSQYALRIKNLGVTVSNDLSWNSHILHVTSAALRLVRQLHRAIPSPSITMIKQLYVTLIRPKIEYAQPAISPSVTALSQLERVQRKCTKWGVLRHMSYTKRLEILQLPTIAERRLRGDNIQMFKYFTKEHIINWINPPIHSSRTTRQHHLKYSTEQIHHHTSTSRFTFLPIRVATNWNSHPHHLAECTTINEFKKDYDLLYHANLLPKKKDSQAPVLQL